MEIKHFYDKRTHSLTYVVHDPANRAAVIIDPVLDFDASAGRTYTDSAEHVAVYLDALNLDLVYALDTHPHADHLSALPFFKDRFGARTVIGKGIVDVQKTWRDLFNLGDQVPTDGSQFDILVEEGTRLEFGSLHIQVLATNGHTPASVTYLIEDALFVGDLLFQPDSGTARCDFPGGSAGEEYDSVQRLYELPGTTRVFTLHDYQPGGRDLEYMSTIGEQKQSNIHLNSGVTRDEFIALRARLEEGKGVPNLLFPAVQINIAGGALPEPESNGTRYLKIPLNLF